MKKISNIKIKLSVQIILLISIISLIQIVKSFYDVYDLSPPSAFSIIGYAGIFWITGDWFIKDSKKRGIDWAFDMGFFMYLAWTVLLPCYLFKTRGLKETLKICLSFIVFYFGISLVSFLIFDSILP